MGDRWVEVAIGLALTIVVGLGIYKVLPTPVQTAISNTVTTQLSQLP